MCSTVCCRKHFVCLICRFIEQQITFSNKYFPTYDIRDKDAFILLGQGLAITSHREHVWNFNYHKLCVLDGMHLPWEKKRVPMGAFASTFEKTCRRRAERKLPNQPHVSQQATKDIQSDHRSVSEKDNYYYLTKTFCCAVWRGIVEMQHFARGNDTVLACSLRRHEPNKDRHIYVIVTLYNCVNVNLNLSLPITNWFSLRQFHLKEKRSSNTTNHKHKIFQVPLSHKLFTSIKCHC